MADNTEETKPTEEPANEPADGASGDEASLSSDQSFTYWMVMLPFIATAGVFIYKFSGAPGETNHLINAAGAIVVGIFVASFVNVLTQGSDKDKEEGAASNEAPKAEGTS